MFSCVKEGTLTLRAVAWVHPNGVVTCSAHSGEHFETSLAEYCMLCVWGGGGGVVEAAF